MRVSLGSGQAFLDVEFDKRTVREAEGRQPRNPDKEIPGWATQGASQSVCLACAVDALPSQHDSLFVPDVPADNPAAIGADIDAPKDARIPS